MARTWVSITTLQACPQFTFLVAIIAVVFSNMLQNTVNGESFIPVRYPVFAKRLFKLLRLFVFSVYVERVYTHLCT